MAAAFDILFSWGCSNPVLPQVINCVLLQNLPAFMLEMLEISLGQGCIDLLAQGLMKEILFPGRKKTLLGDGCGLWGLNFHFVLHSLFFYFLFFLKCIYTYPKCGIMFWKKSLVKTWPLGLVRTTLAYFKSRAWLRGIINRKDTYTHLNMEPNKVSL